MTRFLVCKDSFVPSIGKGLCVPNPLICRASQRLSIQADEEIDGVALEHFETHQELIEGPAVSTYNYLREVLLDDGSSIWEVNPLGELRFIEGDRPGSNRTYVEAPDLASLACRIGST